MDADAIPNEEITRMVHSMMPFAATLGLEFFEASATKVVARAAWASQHCTATGLLHGGFLMAAADSVGAACAWLNLPQGSKTATIESKTNFFRAVKQGKIEVIATPVHIGRTTIVVQTDIVREKGELVSRTIQTQAVIS